MEKYGIYIHFPFCASKCKYCDFNSYANINVKQVDYFQALIREINLYSNKDNEIDTIYIGGGTPSIMFDGCITTLMTEIKKNFNLSPDAEISIECNPNSVTLAKAREWKESGINRVSIGLQTTSPNLLKVIGRIHTVEDYIRAVDNIRLAGITNINTDCLIGLPKQKLSQVKHTLRFLAKLNIPHISVYSLILEDGTPIKKMVDNGELKVPKEEKTLSMYNYTHRFLGENGYTRYEVSNFAKQNYECKHNLHTWQMHRYYGFGAGAHGFVGENRYSNYCDIDKYINSLSEGDLPIENKEIISSQEMFEETIMLGMRTKYGVNLSEIKSNFGVELLESKKKVIDKLIVQGFINIVEDNIIATDLGFTVLNKIILELI